MYLSLMWAFQAKHLWESEKQREALTCIKAAKEALENCLRD